jgi:hypothetical protein
MLSAAQRGFFEHPVIQPVLIHFWVKFAAKRTGDWMRFFSNPYEILMLAEAFGRTHRNTK